ncbi:MAG: hypothetical protein M3040_02280, partial [Bacteroidota bacterium]|nr:hypothetical protein [Bacteroidota bacterium]
MIPINGILFFGLFNFFSCSQRGIITNLSLKEEIKLPRQDTIIQLTFYNNTTCIKIKGDPAVSSVVFISLHNDETTGQQVVSNYVKKNNSAFIQIENNKHRLISFTSLKRKYVFDPNRIFSKKGVRLTLELCSTYSPMAAIKVKKFADLILKQLSGATTIIAVHNNSHGKYSILSFLKGGNECKNAHRVNKVPKSDPDDFFLTTSTQLFNRLKAKNFNIVLQDNEHISNDGSLSYYY